MYVTSAGMSMIPLSVIRMAALPPELLLRNCQPIGCARSAAPARVIFPLLNRQ